MLLDRLGFPVVATSGNRRDEPIETDEYRAIPVLAGLADCFLIHDRPIVRRVDDSVVRRIEGGPVVYRAARGLTPAALPAIEAIAGEAGLPPILAVGGDLKSAIAFWTGSQAVLGPHIGDMGTSEGREAFEETVRGMRDLYRFSPEIIACDMHPDYFTTRWAESRGVRTIPIQHHHAHAAACIAEHGLFDRDVLALAWDGAGYGLDGSIWGGEVLRVRSTSWERIASLRALRLPGGDAAVRETRRIALAVLLDAFPDNKTRRRYWSRRLGFRDRDAVNLEAMIDRGLNSPLACSVGRLFDAVAALTLEVHQVSYEGEAAIALEAAASADAAEPYPLEGGDWRMLVRAVADDLETGADRGLVASRYHESLAAWAEGVVRNDPCPDVVLGGGCFQNRLLTERVCARLRAIGKRVHLPRRLPPGDGGLAAGQLAAAVLILAGSISRSGPSGPTSGR
jgi:hydrogenase maturation protein HypF